MYYFYLKMVKKRTRPAAYVVWTMIKQRCYNKKHTHYDRYGGRGIRVCERWINSYDNFILYMGGPPPPRHTIERIDNEGNYNPSNCRWATQKEQAQNRRNTVAIAFNGETMCLTEWAKKLNIGVTTLHWRIFKRKWPIEKAFISGNSQQKMITHNGKTQSLVDWSRQVGIKKPTIAYRINAGWPLEKVFGAPNLRPKTALPDTKR